MTIEAFQSLKIDDVFYSLHQGEGYKNTVVEVRHTTKKVREDTRIEASVLANSIGNGLKTYEQFEAHNMHHTIQQLIVATIDKIKDKFKDKSNGNS